MKNVTDFTGTLVSLLGIGVSLSGLVYPSLGRFVMILAIFLLAVNLRWLALGKVTASREPEEVAHIQGNLKRRPRRMFTLAQAIFLGILVFVVFYSPRTKDAKLTFFLKASTPKSGREVEYHGAKTPLLSQTLVEIQNEIKKVSRDREWSVMEPLSGKWMRVEGAVIEVHKGLYWVELANFEKKEVMVQIKEGWIVTIEAPSPSAGALCTSDEDFSRVGRGDVVRVIGKLENSVRVIEKLESDDDYFSLSECELLGPLER